MSRLPGPAEHSAQRAAPGRACTPGRWRCRLGWLVYLLVAVAVVIAFGSGA